MDGDEGGRAASGVLHCVGYLHYCICGGGFGSCDTLLRKNLASKENCVELSRYLSRNRNSKTRISEDGYAIVFLPRGQNTEPSSLHFFFREETTSTPTQ